jgi:tetratricopeptide (TPR) repeat protein
MRWMSVILLIFISVCAVVAQELTAEELYAAGIEAYWSDQNDEALDFFTQTIEKDPEFAQAYAYRGSSYRAELALDLVGADLEMAQTLAPDDPIVLGHLARWHGFQADYETALTLANRAVELAPQATEPRYQRARVYEDMYDFENALVDYEYAFNAEDATLDMRVNFAGFLQTINRYAESITIYEDVIEEYPTYARAYYGLGYAYRNLGRYDEALAFFAQVEEVEPGRVDGIIARGVTLVAYMGDIEAGIAEFNHALEIDPSDSNAYRELGIVYLHSVSQGLALNSWNQAIELDPTNAVAYYNRATATSDSDPIQAEQDFLQAIKYRPRYHQALMNLANLYRNQGRYDEALQYYDRAIHAYPYFWFAHWNRGVAYSDMGEYEKAIAVYEIALEMNPYYPDIYDSMGIDYTHLGEYQKAIQAFETAIGLDPNNGRYYYGLGLTYTLMGEIEKSDEMLAKASELGF